MDRTIPDHRAQTRDFVRQINKFLSAKAWVDRHNANQITQIQKMRDTVGGCSRVQRHPSFHACTTNGLQRAVNMRARLNMRGQNICPCIRIGINIGVNRRDHQMHIHDRFYMRPKGLHRRRAKGEVRHKMPIHDIDMHPIRPLRLNGADLCTKIGKIRRENRRGDFYRAIKGHRAGLSKVWAKAMSLP